MIGEENAKSERIAQAVERTTIAKVSWRLLPLIVVLYCVAYIDRTNISFASLTMNKDLGLTAFVYGLGAGIFFLSYFLFEIPIIGYFKVCIPPPR